jgi:hypothetical protein
VTERLSQTELRVLLRDILEVWGLDATLTAEPDHLRLQTATVTLAIRQGPAPTRWFLATPTRTRPHPSLPALLTALRQALGLPPGARARVGPGAAPL